MHPASNYRRQRRNKQEQHLSSSPWWRHPGDAISLCCASSCRPMVVVIETHHEEEEEEEEEDSAAALTNCQLPQQRSSSTWAFLRLLHYKSIKKINWPSVSHHWGHKEEEEEQQQIGYWICRFRCRYRRFELSLRTKTCGAHLTNNARRPLLMNCCCCNSIRSSSSSVQFPFQPKGGNKSV